MVILYLSVSYSKDKDTPPYTTTMNIRNPCSFVHLLHPYYFTDVVIFAYRHLFICYRNAQHQIWQQRQTYFPVIHIIVPVVYRFPYFKSTGIFCDGHIPCINDFHFVFSTSLHFSVGSILCRKIEQPFVLYLLTEINQIITLVSRSRPMVTTDIRQLQRMRQRIQQTAGKTTIHRAILLPLPRK